MARQTIALARGNCVRSTSGISWIYGSGRPQINSRLVPAGTNRFLHQISFANAGHVFFTLDELASGADSDARDLSSAFEMMGTLTITTSQGSLTVEMGNDDTSDPYIWTPSNSAAVTAFFRLHLQGTQFAGTLVLDDHAFFDAKWNNREAVEAKWNDMEVAQAKYNGVELF